MADFVVNLQGRGMRGRIGPKGDPSGPLGAGSVTAETISDDSGEQAAILAKIGGTSQGDLDEQVGTFDIPPSGKVSALGGVVRQSSSGAGWAFINDAGHEPLNMSGALVVNASGNLEVPYATTYGKVGVVPVTVDETFAGLGILPGGSVANNKIRISAFKTLDVSINLATANAVPSTYFTGRVSATKNADGTITITHPSVGSAAHVPLLTSLSGPYNHKIISYTATTVVIGVFTKLRFRVWYDGSAWRVSTPAKVKPTVTSFSGNLLTIAYNQTVPTAYALPIVGSLKGSTAISRVGVTSNATTQLVVAFYDYSGTAVSAASTDMDFIVELPIEVLAETPLGTASISRPNCKLNLSDVYSADGNFWIGPGLNIR